MLFYKFVDSNNVIVDARSASTITFIRKSKKSDRTFICYDRNKADGVLIGSKNYFFQSDEDPIKMIAITPLEYDQIKPYLIQDDLSNDVITDDNFSQDFQYSNDVLYIAKQSKLRDLKSYCNKAIIAGIDIHYSETMTKHFDLTVEDQLNLSALRYQLLTSDQDTFAYHSKDDNFQYYTRAEIQFIIQKIDEHILYHTAYFNSLKNYVNSLTSIDEVDAIIYGQDFPDMYKSQILLDIIDK